MFYLLKILPIILPKEFTTIAILGTLILHRLYVFMRDKHILFHRIALAGTDLTDRNFMDKLLSYRDVTTIPEEKWCAEEAKRNAKQEETMYKLQATVEAQGKILKVMAKRLNITDYEN